MQLSPFSANKITFLSFFTGASLALAMACPLHPSPFVDTEVGLLPAPLRSAHALSFHTFVRYFKVLQRWTLRPRDPLRDHPAPHTTKVEPRPGPVSNSQLLLLAHRSKR